VPAGGVGWPLLPCLGRLLTHDDGDDVDDYDDDGDEDGDHDVVMVIRAVERGERQEKIPGPRSHGAPSYSILDVYSTDF